MVMSSSLKTSNPVGAAGLPTTSTANPAFNDTSNANFTIMPGCNPSTIYGYGFNDSNENKIKDTGEASLSNWIISLKGYDTPIPEYICFQRNLLPAGCQPLMQPIL